MRYFKVIALISLVVALLSVSPLTATADEKILMLNKPYVKGGGDNFLYLKYCGIVDKKPEFYQWHGGSRFNYFHPCVGTEAFLDKKEGKELVMKVTSFNCQKAVVEMFLK